VLGAEREAEQTGLESDECDEGEGEAEGGCDDDLVGLVEVLPDWECHGCSRASRLERGNESDSIRPTSTSAAACHPRAPPARSAKGTRQDHCLRLTK
jgi:hypothetical protein